MTIGFPSTLAKRSPEPEKTSRKLTQNQTKVLSYIEQRYYETGLIATTEACGSALDLPVGVIRTCLSAEIVKSALLARGIDLERVDDLTVLTPVQLALANMLLNIHDKTSVRMKLEALNVTSQQYHAWLRQPAFQNYLRKRAEETFKAADSDAYLGLIKAVQNGDIKAIQLFFEMRGIYNPRVQVDINIDVVMTRVIEIISRHITDEHTLNAIATDFEQLSELKKGA